jgi:hypothetical protein
MFFLSQKTFVFFTKNFCFFYNEILFFSQWDFVFSTMRFCFFHKKLLFFCTTLIPHRASAQRVKDNTISFTKRELRCDGMPDSVWDAFAHGFKRECYNYFPFFTNASDSDSDFDDENWLHTARPHREHIAHLLSQTT